MNLFAGKPSFLIIARNNDSHIAWRCSTSPILVEITIEDPHILRGKVIGSSIPLQPLKDVAPALLQYLTSDGTRIILPRSSAIDSDLLVNFANLIVDQHRAGVVFDLDVSALPQDPVKLIKLHVILELFGLDNLATSLFERLWRVFATHVLMLEDVFWIWGALGLYQEAKWIPKSTDEYLQMMAWSILNADAEGRLDAILQKFFLEEEGELRHLTRLLEKRYRKYGLGRETPQKAVGEVHRQRRATATEHEERTDDFITPAHRPTPDYPPLPFPPPPVSYILPPSSSLVSAGLHDSLDGILSPSLEGPIFPAKWLFPQKPTDICHRTPQHGGIEALCQHGKWVGNEKNVKNMAAKCDELVRWQKGEAFDKSVSTPPVYMEFGYVGWCDKKGGTKKK